MQLFAGAGPNVGRRFRCCANPQRLSCGFFAGAVRVRASSSQRDLCNWRPGSSLRMHKQHQTKRRRHPSLPCSAREAYKLLCSARNRGQGVVTPLLASSALSGSYSRTPCHECTLLASHASQSKKVGKAVVPTQSEDLRNGATSTEPSRLGGCCLCYTWAVTHFPAKVADMPQARTHRWIHTFTPQMCLFTLVVFLLLKVRLYISMLGRPRKFLFQVWCTNPRGGTGSCSLQAGTN